MDWCERASVVPIAQNNNEYDEVSRRRLRNQALGMLELASTKRYADVRLPGGGFAGVKTVGALNDFVHQAIGYYPALSKTELRVVLVHPNSVILPELDEIRTDTRVTAFSECGVELSNGETIPTQNFVWTAGATPPAVLQDLPLKKERERIVVNETLEVPGFSGVRAQRLRKSCALPRDGRWTSASPETSHNT